MALQINLFIFKVMIVPPLLQAKDTIAIVATAKKLSDDLEKSIQILKSWDLEVRVHPNTYLVDGYFAGSDEQRLNALQESLDDPQVKAILFARGGYGTTRIIDQINWSTFLKYPKWLIGFSDLTSLLLQMNQMEVAAIHGSMAYTLPWHPNNQKTLYQLLFGTEKMRYVLNTNPMTREGTAKGKIVGGNLSLIIESIGTRQEIQIKGNILLLEEVGEATYSIDRMLNKLKRMDKLKGIKGLLVGDISQNQEVEDNFGRSALEVIHSYFDPQNIPMGFGLKLGHEKENHAFLVNTFCRIDVASNHVDIGYETVSRSS